MSVLHSFLSLLLTFVLFFFFNLSSSLQLSLQYLSKLVAHSYYYSILVRGLFISISFLIITLFTLFWTLLPMLFLCTHFLLNSWMNFSIVLSFYSIFLSLATLTNFSSSLPNFFFNSIKNSLVNSNPTYNSKFSNIFFFQTSTNLPYIYNSIHWTCSFTTASLILILKYNLHAIINSTTLLAFILNTSSFVTSILGLVLDFYISTLSTLLAIINCNIAFCFCCNLICSKSWLKSY